MGLAETLVCTYDPKPFMLIPIAHYLENGTAIPVVFYKRGDKVDLARVNAESFRYALKTNEVKRNLENGRLALVQVDVADKVEIALAPPANAVQPVPNHGGEMVTVTIEPGIQCGVGAGNLSAPAPVEVPAAPQVTETKELEPGISVTTEPEVQEEVPAAAPEPEVVSWKDNLSFDQQKKFLQASTDKVFLQSVLDDAEETLKIKKIAKERLASL